MTLKLKIVSEHRNIVGDDAVREFSEEGGSIGRSLQNDWILPDADRYISARHAVIDYRGGMYYLADLSTNGVYVNDEVEPIGSGNPRRLYNGDRLRMGDFDISVSVESGESLVVPLDDDSSMIRENVEQLVSEDLPLTGIQMLDEEEITGDAAFRSALQGPSSEATTTAKSINRPVKTAKVETRKAAPKTDAAEPKAKKPVIKPQRVEITADDLLDTFLDGLGISRTDLHPSVDPAEVMQNAGEVLKEFVAGMAKLLVSRANLKTAFQLNQTTVLPRHNNPLKLSQNTTDSVKQLLVGRDGEYLGPRDAVREVCRDLLFHQDAFLDAMSAAFVQFADRFDPEELTSSFEHSIDAKPMFGFLNKFRYWQLYCDMYPVMTEKGGGRFPRMFAEEFVKSYERQVAEFIRSNPSDSAQPKNAFKRISRVGRVEDLKKTVTFERKREFVDPSSSPPGRARG